MKVSLSWMRDYVDIILHPAEIARRLTMAGLEARSMQAIGGDWDNIVTGKVVAVNPHPNADRLKLATVDLAVEQQTVVCGAPNLKVGDKVAFARVGAKLIDPYKGGVFTLKTASIRGVSSSGMVCSEKELGISENHEGIMVLPEDAPVGVPLIDYLGDTIFDFEVTPNRPDCLSVTGIARELAVLTGKSLCLPEVAYEESEELVEKFVSLEIAAPDLCPRYCASVIAGVKLAPSPEWMQRRLLACGMRPINNIVDVTNYVMLEYGQPLHAFDYHTLNGKKIIVRRAREGEVITSLDGVDRALSTDMLVIADAERAVAIAGVMGGANTEVTEGTTTVLLESANFKAISIHHTGDVLHLPSEARYRFERGIRPELTLLALKRATRLLVQLAGGKAAKGVADLYPGKQEPEPILLSVEKVNRLLGYEVSTEQVEEVLTSLGFACKRESASKMQVTAPYWRSDISLAVDLIEEVARINGYDKIPATLLSEELPRQKPEPINNLKREVMRSLTGFGFQEIITYSLTSLDVLKKLSIEPPVSGSNALRLENPMSVEQECLRPDLRGTLLMALATNRKYEEGGVRLFELGKVYLPAGNKLPDQPDMVCAVMSGPREEQSWGGGRSMMDFFDAKGAVESLFNKLGVEVGFEAGKDESLHPGKQADILIGGKKLGVLGEFHPRVSQAFEITEPVYMFEINLTALVAFTIGHRMCRPIPRFPAVVRDIALIVDIPVTHRRIQQIIKSFSLVENVAVFDVYSGEQVPPGKKSLAYRVTYQSPNHTLTDEEVEKVQQQILGKLSRELGAILRS